MSPITTESPAMRVERTTAPPELTLESIEPPDGPRQPAHCYSRLETTIRMTAGALCVVCDGEERVLTPGDELVVPAGSTHERWNAGEADAVFTETFRTTI